MKKYMRFSIVVVAMVMLLSMTSVYVSAANTTPETIGYEIFVDGRALIPREKDDATAHYFYVSSSTYSVMQISSFGLSNFFDSYDQDQNTTRSNGQYVHHVACRVGTKYSIVNRVYEDGYPWATLSLLTTIVRLVGIYKANGVPIVQLHIPLHRLTCDLVCWYGLHKSNTYNFVRFVDLFILRCFAK